MKASRATIQKRQSQLLKQLQSTENCDVNQLAELLKVSPVTVRRDLKSLGKLGLIDRYFGGARIRVNAQEDERIYMETTTQFLPEKQAIARRAAELLEDDDIVFINSSSTALLVCSYVRDKSLCIVTNNAKILNVPSAPGIELILTGGEVNGNKQSLVGQAALDTLSHITATKCILGVSGISARGGITSRVIQETSINQMMLSRCTGRKIVVADHTKIGLEHNFFSGEAADITHLITADTAPRGELDELRKLGISVLLVRPEES